MPFPYQPHLTKNPLSFKYEFKSGTAGVRAAYADCAAGSRHVYALFYGTRNRAFAKTRPWTRAFVHVFDWTGKREAILELDHPAESIAVDQDERTIYTVVARVDSAPTVRRTKLP